MTLTNGEVYAKIVYLPDETDYWAEIPDSEVPDTSEDLTDTEALDIILDR